MAKNNKSRHQNSRELGKRTLAAEGWGGGRGRGWISLHLKKRPLGVWSAPRRVGFLEPYLVSTGGVAHGVCCLDPRPLGLDVTWITGNLDTQSWGCFPYITVPSGKPTISQSWGKLFPPPREPDKAEGARPGFGGEQRARQRPKRETPPPTHTYTHTHLGIQGPPENCTLEVSRRFHPDLQTRSVRTDPYCLKDACYLPKLLQTRSHCSRWGGPDDSLRPD